MNVFLSYASEHVDLAARIASGLTQEGDDVFFDRESLPVGEGYHQRIRDAIEAADLFVFLVAPASLTPGSYAVAELELAATAAALGRPRLKRGGFVWRTRRVEGPSACAATGAVDRGQC